MTRRSTRPRSTRRLAGPARLALLAGAAVLALAGCGSGEEADPAAEPTLPAGHAPTDGSAERTSDPDTGTEAGSAWNPCDGLAVARVARVLGTEVEPDRGTTQEPRCTLRPAEEGGPVLDANYTVFTAGLDSAWETMGAPEDGSVSEPRIAGADDARLVVSADESGLTATGFVQNGPLIHVVNAADTAPFDRAKVERAVRLMMTQLSAHSEDAARAGVAQMS